MDEYAKYAELKQACAALLRQAKEQECALHEARKALIVIGIQSEKQLAETYAVLASQRHDSLGCNVHFARVAFAHWRTVQRLRLKALACHMGA